MPKSNRLKMNKLWWIDAAGVALMLGLATLLYVFEVSPTLNQHQQHDLKAGEVTTAGQDLASRKKILTVWQKQLAEVHEALVPQTLQLQPVSQLNQRISTLASIASDNKLEIDGIQPGVINREDRFQSIGIAITGRGKYNHCATFLHQLHEQLPDTAVISLEMSQPKSEADSQLAVTFELRWYTAPSTAQARK